MRATIPSISRYGAGLLCAVLIVCACASNDEPMEPPPARREVLNYPLEIGDELEIRVFNYEEITQEVPIRPDGVISFAPVGEVKAEGLTILELDAVLTERLAPFFNNPLLTVFVKSFANLKVYVGGEVRSPGIIALQERTTAIMAIIAAGGLLDTSQVTNVVVLREAPEGGPLATVIDLKQVLSGEASDMLLQPYDIVYVPMSKVARANLWVEQYIRRVIPFRLVASGNFSYVDGNRVSSENVSAPVDEE